MGAAFRCTRQLCPISFGIFMGSLFSLLIFPYFENNIENFDQSKILDESCKFDNFNDLNPPEKDEYEPILKSAPKNLGQMSNSNSKKPAKILRPRFYATELEVKDKLFVAVVNKNDRSRDPNDQSRDQTDFTSALNKTTAHHVNRLVFFFGDRQKSTDQENQPGHNRYSQTSKFFSAFSYVVDRFGQNYDWFYFISDESYIKAFKLFEFVTHLSSGFDVILGKKLKNQPKFRRNSTNFQQNSNFPTNFCSIPAGLLISNGAAKKINEIMNLCKLEMEKTAETLFENDDPSINFGKCAQKFANIACSEEWNGKIYKSVELPENSNVGQILTDKTLPKDNFNHALSISNVKSTKDIFLLHKYFCEIELDQINDLIRNIENELFHNAKINNETLHWPIGLAPPLRPKTRFEVPKWDYFDKNLIFELKNNRNARKLDGLNAQDLKNVLNFTLVKIRQWRQQATWSNFYQNFDFVQFLHGYRKFDPNRGMEYLLDLEFKPKIIESASSADHVIKRFRLLRPLGKVELVPSPHVTESNTVVLVLPVTLNLINQTFVFLKNFEENCLKIQANVKLILIFSIFNGQNVDYYRFLIDHVTFLKRKYTSQDLIYFETRVLNGQIYTQIKAVNLILHNFGQNFVYFLINPFMQISLDMLNRVRMNVVEQFQIFFPIPFLKYRLNFGYKLPQNLDFPQISKSFGRFDNENFNFVGFYGSDLYKILKNLTNSGQSPTDFLVPNNLIDLILRAAPKNLHILRYPEPSLIVDYYEKQCENEANSENYANCVYSMKEGLGSKAQLASLMVERGLL